MTMRMLVFEPLVPMGLWVGLVLAACALLVYYGLGLRGRVSSARRVGILTLMSLACALPLVLLLNPQWVERLPPPAGKPVLTLLVDTSASMATPDATDGSTRLAAARQVAEGLAARLQSRFEIEPRQFDTTSRPLDLEEPLPAPDPNRRTDLAAAIDTVLANDRPQGQAVVVLSDGIHNSGGGEARVLASARRAKAMAVPLFTQSFGGRSSVRDLTLDVRSPQELAFVGQSIPLHVVLESQGLSGAQAELLLTLDDGQDNKEIERRTVPLTGDKPIDVDFMVSRPASGIYRYEVTAAPLVGEATTANNSATLLLRVVDEPIRVLLLEGKPYWDTKFLLRTLAADPSLEVVSIVRMADHRLLERRLSLPAESKPADVAQAPANQAPAPQTGAARTETAPEAQAKSAAPPNGRGEQWKITATADDLLSNADRLRDFQIVILGRDAEVYLNEDSVARLKSWIVHDGGSLVCFRGAPAVQITERLAQLLPVRWNAAGESRFHVEWTDDGRALGWLGSANSADDSLARLPSLATHAPASRLQPLATVLAVGQLPSGESSPVVTSLPYGTGRVVAVEGAGMWRWAFMAPQYQNEQRIYGALWHSLTRWLVAGAGLLPNQSWALRSDKVRFDTEEETTLSLLVRESALAAGVPKIELAPVGSSQFKSLSAVPAGDDPGAFRVACGRLPAGRYAAHIAGSQTTETSARTVFEVRTSVDELIKLDANANLLKRASELSGGVSLADESADQLAAMIEKQMAQSRPEQFRTTSAWDRWWVLVGVIGVWGLSWSFRRRWGFI